MSGLTGTFSGIALAAATIVGSPCCLAADAALAGTAGATERIVSISEQDGRAMAHLDYLVNEIGSRPANSVNALKAYRWARDEFRKFGLANVHLEKCGEMKGDFSGKRETARFERLHRLLFHDAAEGDMVPICNVVADLPGSERPDEYVIVGAHIDSAPQGPGATDNGAGVAAVMEAARILAAAEAGPSRTIRFILFGGEEVGLVGSNGYVDNHPDLVAKISAVYNMDHGAGYITGIMATEPLKSDLREIFATVMALEPEMPFAVEEVEYLPRVDPNCCASMVQKSQSAAGIERVVTAGGCGATSTCATACGVAGPGRIGKQVEKVIALGSSDHAPFLAAGIPAFWWNQTESASAPYPAHTPEDTYDKVNARHLAHSARVIALGAFGTANLDHMLSRDRLAAPAEIAAGAVKPIEAGTCNPGCAGNAGKSPCKIAQ